MDHIQAYCWKLKKKKGKEEKEKTVIADCVVESESDGDVLLATTSLATTSEKRLGDDWVLDSGCTYHMCPRRD